MSHDNSKSTTVEQYLKKLSGQEKEPEVISVDHNYAKIWSSHPDSNHARPARLLFMKGMQRYPHLMHDGDGSPNLEIDVVSCDEPIPSPFDNPKLRLLMGECDRHLKYNPLLDDIEDKEDGIRMNGWSGRQRRMYKQVMKTLQTDRLSKLAYAGTANEPIKRRMSIDKTARRLRLIYASVSWDMKLLSWLHQMLMNNLNTSTLTVYLDALQTLKAKVPNLVDKMLSPLLQRPGNADSLSQLLKRQWDPLLPQLSHHKPRKLPGNPIFVVTPSSPTQQLSGSHTQRLRFWHNHLSSLGKVINVPICSANGSSTASVGECLDLIITAVRNKVIELKSHYPTRPVILIGWTIGALIACHVALEEEVTAIICLGFPLTGINGSRGDLDDPLLSNNIPTLFVVGQNANMSAPDDVEDFRSRMKAESSLVIVGGADDVLKVSRMKKKIEGISQTIVDRCLVDEISDFLLMVLNVQLPPPTTSTSQVSSKYYTTVIEYDNGVEQQNRGEEELKQRRRRKPREYSPELSPVRKRSKPNTSRQAQVTTSKARLSLSSSETSSSGSCTEKSPVKGAGKKSIEKRGVGRPAAGTWRKRLNIKPIIDPHQSKTTAPPEKISKPEPIPLTPKPPLKAPTPVILPAPVMELTPARPFPVKILEQKSNPVDVENAFGKDISFLPRPLTPNEPEDTVSAEESENAISELEALANSTTDEVPATVLTKPPIPTFSSVDKSSEPVPIAISETLVPATTTTIPTMPVMSPIIVSKVSESNEPRFMSAIKTTPSIRTVFPQAKILTTSALQNLRSGGNISLVASTQGGGNLGGKQQSYVLTMPSGNATTFLVSSPDGRTQQAKMIQLHKMPANAKGLPVKPPSLSSLLTSSSAAAAAATSSSDQQVCNLSLLSDVAGMTAPMQDNQRKVTTDPQLATLVKLAPTDGGGAGNNAALKCLKVIKSVAAAPIRASSPPVRQETAEEMVEKQLAIQALNKSIGIETPSTLLKKEPGYSICYTKPDGSVISRAVPKPNYATSYLANSRGRGRGRGQSMISVKDFMSQKF